MKTTFKHMDYDQVMALPRPKHKKPRKVSMFFRTLIRALTIVGMKGTRFRWEGERMELLDKKEPCLILMNHSCFTDMQIAYRIFYPRHFCIVSTYDGLIGMGGFMEWLMRSIGCIPTQKFVSDLRLIQDMDYAFKELKTSVLMYPEAGYSFDGTATTMPRKMGILLKKFDVPVVMVQTQGAFSRNPLYNELQVRKKVPVSATVKCLFTREEIREKTVAQLTAGVEEAFTFDQFRWQQEQGLKITEPFRADGLNRILYKCIACGAEGRMVGKGTTLTCPDCGKTHELTPLGQLEATDGNTPIPHIPDYYAWEREQVRQEILAGTYRMELDVKIGMLVDFKARYTVGEGKLVHDLQGFTLTGCDGKLHYTQKPTASHSLNSDFFWYEVGDVIGLGDSDKLFYCFPQNAGDVVAKARLAAEELYKLHKDKNFLKMSINRDKNLPMG